jgi:cysteine synthase A
MIEHAEKNGLITKQSVIVEPTSGNTGIGISLVGCLKGYKVKIVMPENMSLERRMLIKSLGAEIILTPAKDNIEGAVNYAQILKANYDNIYIPNQFANEANPSIHYATTAQEIWEQTDGNIGCFVSGIGSGGTIQGIASFLKEKNPAIKIIAVEPKNASAILGHEPGLHQIQGIGDGFIPEILDTKLIDEVIEVSDEDAIETSRVLSQKHGLMVGISSGANIWASQYIRKTIEGNIITILADRSERYFSTSLMDNALKQQMQVVYE